jgi:hypothetical protein
MHVALTALILGGTLAQTPGTLLTERRVDAAIGRMKEHLYATQNKQAGHFEVGSYATGSNAGGQTALVVLAMLMAGESPQNPPLAKAIAWLKTADPKHYFTGTYAVAIRAHVWAALSAEQHVPLLRRDAAWLLDAASKHPKGLFDYGNVAPSRIDHSVTQYGTLGLWEAAKRGLPFSKSVWRKIQAHFIGAQRPDGGWNYGGDGQASYGSMTAAGLTALIICRQELYSGGSKIPKASTEAIQRGLSWLDTNFDGPRNSNNGSWPFYYLVSIERVALAGGIRELGGVDWYGVGAGHILSQQQASGGVGGQPWNTAFALMFLARGRYPVWVSKLAIPSARWNLRPDDLYRLTAQLSDMTERELNWQVVSIDTQPEHWLNAPLLCVTSADKINLTPPQTQRLRRYLDLGGMLVAVPHAAATDFRASIRQFARTLYPRFRMRRLPADHPFFKSLHQIEYARAGRVEGISNGVRELIVMLERDWAADKGKVGAGPPPLAANIYAHLSDRGRLPSRLASHYERRIERRSNGTFQVGRLRYDGEWLPEPAAWEVVGNRVFNRHGIDVQTVDLELETLSAEADAPALMHLAGIDAVELSALQLAAVERYARSGGTVLIETVGGRGDFARSVEKQLADHLETAAAPLGRHVPMLSGEGVEGAVAIERVRYRRRAAVILSARSRPRLAAFAFDGRPAILISREDMTLGMMGVRHADILGYAVESALELATNIVLRCHANKRTANAGG